VSAIATAVRRDIVKTLIVLSATALSLGAFQASTTTAETWHILSDGTGHAPTIQAGLDMCAVGDTVLVAPGVYDENLVWPAVDGITLRSESGTEATVVDGGGIGRVITITTGVGESTRIDGFTIRNGLASSAGGIYCALDSSPTISNNLITDNKGTINAGGIGCTNDSSPIIINNTITMNTAADGVGGGIGGSINCSPVIDGNTITGNTAASAGGGIILWSQCGGRITGNTIADNVSGSAGGGISCNVDASVRIVGNTITGNSAVTRGGGIDCSHRDSSYIYCNTIKGNTATLGAGICCRDEAETVITYCDIVGNHGSGVYCTRGPGQSANPIIIYNNIVNNAGDGVLNSDAAVTIAAANNWWGDPSGPSGAGPGSGDEVSDYVDYDPWAAGPFPLSTDAGPPVPPVRFVLLQNYPNPFNPHTTIPFSVDKPQRVKLSMYDVTGNRLMVLVDQMYETGSHTTEWSGQDELGRAVSSGLYLVRMQTAGRIESRKIMLVR